MPKVTVKPHPEYAPEGAVFDSPANVSLCDAMLANGVEIDHACGRVGACTTCHVVVREGFELLSTSTESEEDMLDRAWGLEATSRLSCQAIVTEADVAVEIPRYSINHAKENA